MQRLMWMPCSSNICHILKLYMMNSLFHLPPFKLVCYFFISFEITCINVNGDVMKLFENDNNELQLRWQY